MTGAEIIIKCGLTANPGYFSGRGATTSDLTSTDLEAIYQEVLKAFGEEAAKNFAVFVATFPKLAMTTFLNTFFDFVRCGCEWKHRAHSAPDEIHMGKNKDGERDMMSGMCGLAAFMAGGSDRDDTQQIRGMFVHQHADEIGEENLPEMDKDSIFGGW